MRSQILICDIGTTQADAIHYVQGEEGRELQFAFVNSLIPDENGEPSSIDLTGYSVDIHILKSDGNFSIDHCTISNNYALYTLTSNDCIVGGKGIYDLSIIANNEIIYTAHGEYIGDNRAISDSTVNSVSTAYGVTFPDGFQEKLIAGANISIIDNVISSTGGGGGTTDYTLLTNKPSINNTTLTGNKTSSDLGLQDSLTFDSAPTSQSNNPVTSDGIYDALTSKVNTSAIGAASGVAELDASGHVPSSQLPAYVDDVVEGYYYNNVFYEDAAHTIAITGETGKIYIDLPNNLSYRWTGSGYTVISPSLALGETSSTAYRGDRGKIAYDTALSNKDNIADDYNSGNTYNIGDYCLYSGVLYRCNTNSTTGTFTPSKWDYAQICEDLTDLAGDVATNTSDISTLNSNMAIQSGAPSSYNTSYIDLISITYLQMNKLVVVTGSFKTKATATSGGTNLFYGLPSAKNTAFSTAVSGTGSAYKLGINTGTTTIVKDEATNPSNIWYNFTLIYETV